MPSKPKNHKQFAVMIIDRFFLVIFLLIIALSFTTLSSGDTTNYVQNGLIAMLIESYVEPALLNAK